jgi:hypothetical protein
MMRRPPARVLWVLFALPPILLVLLRPSFLVERYLCYLIAPAAAMTALAVEALRPAARPAAFALGALAMLAPIAPTLVHAGTAKNFRTEERWRDALAALDARAHIGDGIALRSGLMEEDAAWRGDRAVVALIRAPMAKRPYLVRNLTSTFEPSVRAALAGMRFVLARDEDGYVDRLLEGRAVLRDERFEAIRLVELAR